MSALFSIMHSCFEYMRHIVSLKKYFVYLIIFCSLFDCIWNNCGIASS